MATNYMIEQSHSEITFAGDHVRLAGQIEYPDAPVPEAGYPLLFFLHHVGWNARSDYDHYAQTALACDYAVFRWDKRGTGHSGAGGRGSTTQDAILAYQTAISQPDIDCSHAVILAQSEATIMLANSFPLFACVQKPLGVILAGSMLDANGIEAIDTAVQIIMGENDWNNWRVHARDAAEHHRAIYPHGASYHVAPNANRMLMVNSQFHSEANNQMRDWLQSL